MKNGLENGVGRRGQARNKEYFLAIQEAVRE